jgi:hypothetical protein
MGKRVIGLPPEAGRSPPSAPPFREFSITAAKSLDGLSTFYPIHGQARLDWQEFVSSILNQRIDGIA